MKNRSSKTILVFFALGLLSCALCVQQARADSITGSITFAGGVELNTNSAGTASMVAGWLDEGGNMPTVVSASGSFASLVGQTAVFAFPWSFNTNTPIAAFWVVDGFTFNLISSQIFVQGDGFVNVFGTGTILGPPQFGGLHNMSWSFSTQDPGGGPGDLVFSFSGGGQALPDGGATVALLGLSLAGIEGIRRKLRRREN